MATTQDASINIGQETTYRTGVTPSRALEFFDESFDWDKGDKQGQGLRVGRRVDRSTRRVIPSAQGGGDLSIEACSKGLGLLWAGALGSGVSTLVSTGVYQQVFTLGDALPSFTVQKGSPEVGGTVDAITFLGCMIDSWELSFDNNDIVKLKTSWDIADLNTGTAYAAPTYASAPNLFHFANLGIYSGALTAPTSTALGAGATQLADIRSLSTKVDNNLRDDRFNAGGAGRKSKPLVGKRAITGKLTAEYDTTAWRDAVLNETPMNIVATVTAGALTTGNETLQLIIPEVKFPGELPKTNGTDLITQDMSFVGLDNEVAAQPIWVVVRTADTAL